VSSPFPVPAPPPRRTEPAAVPDAPATELDDLVRGLDDLAERPVAEHHDRLTEVHDALHAALHQPPTS
jgi:hypothetical protein